MIVACPHCSTGYLLPEDLLGPGGARVRCPRCRQQFAVEPGGRPPNAPASAAGISTAAAPAPAPAHEPVAPAPSATTAAAGAPGAADPLDLARAVLAELASRAGEDLERAAAERRLFAAYGPALMEAYETFRGRAGRGADPAAFREAVRERWGVDLLPLTGREG